MTFLENVLKFLDTSMARPTMYGWFHILSLLLTAAATIVLCRWGNKKDPHKTVLAVAVTVVILEIYKQINFSFSYENGITFDYQWYAFPFQFCSTPMYVGLLAGLTKKGKIHQAACAYLATYAVFAGICVMLYPSTVFVETIGINIQTMFCHGSMIVIGIYLLYSGHVRTDYKTLRKAAVVFVACVGIACVMNEIAYRTGLLATETFDMFFISPYGTPSLPVYSLVQGVVPFPWCLLIYIAAFTFAAYLILVVAAGIKALSKKKYPVG